MPAMETQDVIFDRLKQAYLRNINAEAIQNEATEIAVTTTKDTQSAEAGLIAAAFTMAHHLNLSALKAIAEEVTILKSER